MSLTLCGVMFTALQKPNVRPTLVVLPFIIHEHAVVNTDTTQYHEVTGNTTCAHAL